MFRILRAAPRVLSLATSPSLSHTAKPRSITYITSSTLRPSQSSAKFYLQQRFMSDDIKKADTETGPPDEAAAVDSAVESAKAADAPTENLVEEPTSASADYKPTPLVDLEQDSAAVAAASDAASQSAPFQPRRPEGFGAGRTDDPPRPSTELYIGNLFFDITEEDLKREFSRFGEVKTVRLMYDGKGLSKGFGWLQFDTVENAQEAISQMNQQIFEGRRLAVQFSRAHGKSPEEMRERGRSMARAKHTSRAAGEPSKTLFIGNLAFELTDQDLNELFKDVRNVVDVRVAIDRRTGQPRGFAHADFIDIESAQEALKVLKVKERYGRRLRVDFTSNTATRS